MIEFAGRLHPLLVHLPIGILIIGLVLYWWEFFNSEKNFGPTVQVIFLVGAVTAVLSGLTGLSLAGQGDYDETVLNRHRNTGIALAVVSLYFWFITYRGVRGWRGFYLSLSVMILIFFTGHLGATLTHGGDFLFRNKQKEVVLGPFENIQDVQVYGDLVSPVLQQKCVGCHGPDKQKGKLRLDGEAYIRKGGKSGLAIGSDAEILKRVMLPPDDEDHMPPKEKGQLSDEHLAILKWWIGSGADFKARVSDLKQNDTIKNVLAALQAGVTEEKALAEVSLPEVEAAPAQAVTQLKAAGMSIVPLAGNSNLLSISLYNISNSGRGTWQALAKLSGQAWALKADHEEVDAEAMEAIGQLRMLRKLSLSGASINDSAIQPILNLAELETLNLSGTAITAKGVNDLKRLPKLKRLYLFNTIVDSLEVSGLRAQLKGVAIEAGAKRLPLLPGDTSRLPYN
jgi:uncharacterized membrane protein/mono/diheme cytochrome c family protein